MNLVPVVLGTVATERADAMIQPVKFKKTKK
jgi:hypothetical protein